MIKNLQFRAAADPEQNTVSLYAFTGWRGDRTHLVSVIEMREVGRADVVEPSFRLSMESAQQLIDTLYAAGLRPSDAEGGDADAPSMGEAYGTLYRALMPGSTLTITKPE